MFLKKLKNNNRGADMALIGTRMVLIMVLICCGLIDFFSIEYSKVIVTTSLKQCIMDALVRGFDAHNGEILNQDVFDASHDAANIRRICVDNVNGSLTGGFVRGNGLQDADVYVYYRNNKVVCTITDFIHHPRTMLGGTPTIHSGCSMKITFYPQNANGPLGPI